MLDGWEQALPTLLERLKHFARMPPNEKGNVGRFGCAMGSLNTELGKYQSELQTTARRHFDLFRDWLTRQFQALCPT